MIEVREFVARLDQGWTEAFLCRGADGNRYVVKSIRAGREALVKEWLCGRIGRALDVPIPPFEMLYATDAVARQSLNPELSDVTQAPGFGSQFVDRAATLNVADVPTVGEDVPRLALLFGW